MVTMFLIPRVLRTCWKNLKVNWLFVVRQQSVRRAIGHNPTSDKCFGYGFGGGRPMRDRLDEFGKAIRDN